jgi:hypothetical protein
LNAYSNIIFFIQTTKKFIQIYVTFSQIDIAIISLVSSQAGVAMAIKYLLDKKTFVRQVENINYSSVELNPIINGQINI